MIPNMNTSIMKNKLVEFICRATTVMALALAALPALAATNAANVVREFQCLVVSAEPARHTFRVRHKPTGFEADVVWDDKSRIQVTSAYDIDDLPEGWVQLAAKTLDTTKKSIFRIRTVDTLPVAKIPQGPVEMKPEAPFACKLVRKPVTPEILKSQNRLLTRDGKSAYALEVNGEIWTIETGFNGRPKLSRVLAGTGSDIKAGLLCMNLQYREEGGQNRLLSIGLLPPLPKNTIGEYTPIGASGTTVENIEQAMVKVHEAYKKFAPELRKIMPVRFKLSQEIILPGEPVTLTIKAWATKVPNAVVALNISYLQPDKAQKKELSLQWKAGESADGLTQYTASLNLPTLPVGQHYVSWACDIGGDITEYWRSLAVADSKTLVTMFHQTPGKILPDYDELHLPYDYWDSGVHATLIKAMAGKPLPTSAKEWSWRINSQTYRQRGASPNQPLSCMFQEQNELPHPVNFRNEPEPVQQAYFKAMAEINEFSGFDPKEVAFQSYEFGTKSLEPARKAGVSVIGSLCIHQNWVDGGGHGAINHTARPLRPYFAAADDFRKAGPGGPDAMVMVSQHDKSILWTEYGLGVYEPCWLDWGTNGGGRAKDFDDIFMSRQLDLFSAAIKNTVNQRVPYFQSIGMEFTAASEKVAKSNALMIRYAVERAKKGEVVFCNQAAAADFYRRHYKETPETLFYDADYWGGTDAGKCATALWKPVDYPDLIQIENARYSGYFKKPTALPEYHWDYTKPWNYPDWGNEELPRYKGFLVPGEHDKFAVTPKITDTRKMKVSQSLSENAGGLEMVVTLETAEAIKALPLALWDIPREWKAGEGWWTVKGANRFVPIRAPYTGNLNGILEVDAKPGKNEYRLTIATPQRKPRSQDILLNTVHAKVFTRDGQTMAYIWPMQPWETQFELTVPEGKTAQYYAAPKGERVDLPPGRHRLTINKEN